MDKETAKKVLEIMLTADGGCEFCVRNLYLQFIKEFPQYSYLARKLYRETFNQELVTEDMAESIIKEVINEALKAYNLEAEKIILFGSRARGDHKKDSDWDILLVIKQEITQQLKDELFKSITEKLSHYLIPCDLIIKSSKELEFYKNFYGTVTYEALKEGHSLGYKE
jgi:predicted nucleotidyltransferase